MEPGDDPIAAAEGALAAYGDINTAQLRADARLDDARIDVRIRLGTVDDVPVLCELRRAFTLEDYEPDALRREDYDTSFHALVSDGIESGRWKAWVAEVEGEIVSVAFVAVIEKIPRPVEQLRWIGYLTNVYTTPAERRRGIGGRVLEAVTAWARDAGVELLIVWPSDASVGHYERHGFADRGEPHVWVHPEGGD